MPPKLTKEEQLKILKKERDDAIVAQNEWNHQEFARLEKARKVYVEHWENMANYVAESENQEKTRLSAESSEFEALLTSIRSKYNRELEEVRDELDWQSFLKSIEPEDNPQTIITAMEVLQKSIRHDSTVQELQDELSSIPITRSLVEDQKTIYDIYIEACRRIADILLKLQRYIDYELPYQNTMRRLASRDQEKLCITNDATCDCPTAKIDELFSRGNIFEPQADQLEELIRLTLSQELIKENPTPKVIELEEPKKKNANQKNEKKDKGPVKQETPADGESKKKKRGKKNNVEVVELEPSSEVLEFVAILQAQMDNPEVFIQLENGEISQPISVPGVKSVEDADKGEQQTVQQPLPLEELHKMLSRFHDILTAETEPFIVTEEMQAAANAAPPPKPEDKVRRDQKIADQLKQLVAENSAIAHEIETVSYVNDAELGEIENISTIQRYRILLRGLLYEFEERAVKYVLDNPEEFYDANEMIKMITPAVEQGEGKEAESESEREDQEEVEDASEDEFDGGAGSASKAKTKGLSREMLDNLNRAQEADETQKTQESKEEINLFELNEQAVILQPQKYHKTNNLLNSGTMDEGELNEATSSKFSKLTYRTGKIAYNSQNITSVNEFISLENYRQLYPALRLSMRLQYLVSKANGFFLHSAPAGTSMKQASMLPYICRTDKIYYIGHMRQIGLFFDRVHQKLGVYHRPEVRMSIKTQIIKQQEQLQEELTGQANQGYSNVPETTTQNQEQRQQLIDSTAALEMELAQPKFLNNMHELNYLQSLWVNATKATSSSKISFAEGIKVSLPHALLQQPIGFIINQVVPNILGQSYSEGFDQVEFNNLPRIDLGRFYVSEYLIKQSNRNSILDLLIHLSIYKYINKNTNIVSGADENNPDSLFELPRSSEIDLFLKFEHANMQALGQCRQRLVRQLDQQIDAVESVVDRFNTIQYRDLRKTDIINKFVQLLSQIQFSNQTIEKLDFKIVQEYYRLVRLSQEQKLLVEKKKKQKLAKLNEYFRENLALIQEIIGTVLDIQMVENTKSYLQSLFDELTQVEDVELKKKPKQKVPIPTVDELIAKRRAELEKVDEDYAVQEVPDIIPISSIYFTDMISNPPRPIEANKWIYQDLYTEDIEHSSKGHLAYNMRDTTYDDQLANEEKPEVEIHTFDGKPVNTEEARLLCLPIKYEIYKLKELQKAKEMNIKKQSPSVANLNKSSEPKHATSLYPEHKISDIQYFKPINLRRELKEVCNIYDTTYIDKHWEINENIESHTQYEEISNEHLVSKQYLMVDHLKYPRQSNYFTVYPQMPILRMSEVIKERAMLGSMDVNCLWNYVPNIFDYHNSVITCDANGHQEEHAEEGLAASTNMAATSGGAAGGSFTVPLTFEFQLSPELKATVRSVCTVEEAVKYLREAYDFENYQELIGKYFIGIFNVATNSFDIDGVEKVSYKKETGVLMLELTKLGPVAICSVREHIVPFKGWAIIPDGSRGEGYDISEVVADYEKYINDTQASQVNQDNMNSVTMSSMQDSMLNSTNFMGGYNNDKITRTRYSYFQPTNILSRTGQIDEVPAQLLNDDIDVPYFIKRAITLSKDQNVGIHSVLFRLELTNNILLTIRVLPEGYEVVEIVEHENQISDKLRAAKDKFDEFNNDLFDQINAFKKEQLEKYKSSHPDLSEEELEMYDIEGDETNEEYIQFKQRISIQASENTLRLAKECNLSYFNYVEFLTAMRDGVQEAEELPALFRNIVFTNISDLFAALLKAGLVMDFRDTTLEKAYVESKAPELDAEFAKELALVACTTRDSVPLVQMMTSSPWNRFLPQTIDSYPPQNQFEICQDQFDHAFFLSRGWILPEDMQRFLDDKAREERRDNALVKKYMKEKQCDEKTARKAVVVKTEVRIEKGMPSRLGPAPYGLTSQFVDMRRDALNELLRFIEQYLSAVDTLREVKYEDAGCFVVISNRIRVDGNTATISPLNKHEAEIGEVEVPPQKGERPEVPPDPYAKKSKKKGKKGAVVDEAGPATTDTESLRCTQTKPYINEDIKDAYTLCVSKSGLGGFYLSHVASVPVMGPAAGEEFCNMSLPGTESHASCLDAFVGGPGGECDPLLVMKVFELANALRLATIG